jgi:hypothetical protein
MKILFSINKYKITDLLYCFYKIVYILSETRAAIVSSVKTFLFFDLI